MAAVEREKERAAIGAKAETVLVAASRDAIMAVVFMANGKVLGPLVSKRSDTRIFAMMADVMWQVDRRTDDLQPRRTIDLLDYH